MKLAGYEIDVVVQGYPGKSVCHGGLGWGAIVLIHGRGRVGLIDAGSFGMRRLLVDRLAEHGLAPRDVTDVMLTHAHHDHAVNWVLFKHARIVIGAEELEWSLSVPWGETPVPELYMRELAGWRTLHKAQVGEEVFPGMTAHAGPGHTPGHLFFVLEGAEHDIVFTGDAAKNRAELASHKTDMTYDAAVSAASIEAIWSVWRQKPGSILVPGHDVPMMQTSGRIEYVGKRNAAIKAWLDDNLEKTTLFQLTVD